MIKLNRRGFIAGAGAAASLPLLANRAFADDPLKVGFIYVGPHDDQGWSTAHDRGRLEMEKALAGKVTTSYVENVPEDLYEALRERARKHRKSIAAEVLSLIEQNVPTAAELKRRQLAFRQILQIRKTTKLGDFPSAEQMQREDRDR